MDASGANPFKPGFGFKPPYRAGHKRAALDLGRILDRVAAGGRGDVAAMYGPRGNGKTALLDEFAGKARGSGMRTTKLHTSQMAGNPAALAKWLATDKAFDLGRLKNLTASVAGFGVGVELRDSPEMLVEAVLRGTLEKAPLALMVDEAHDLPPGFGKALLQVAQGCMSDELPLVLVFAGTPVLPFRFRKMGASFWERCRRLRIGRLTEGETRKAFSVPVERAGCRINEDALELLVRESQHYPYFVQMMGESVWYVAADAGSGHCITLSDARKGIEIAKEDVDVFYSERYDEAYEQGIVNPAVAVSKLLIAKGDDMRLADEEFEDAVEAAALEGELPPQVVKQRLVELGLVWRASGRHWEPGIPSLCSHFANKKRRATAGRKKRPG